MTGGGVQMEQLAGVIACQSDDVIRQNWHGMFHDMLHYKADVRRLIKLANFCGRGLVAWENGLIKSLNHDTRPILSFATSYDIS